MKISSTAIIYPDVELGNNIIVEDYCILGSPSFSGVKTIIGDNAHIRAHSIIYPGNIIGKNFTTGNKVNIREFNKIGNNVSIGTHTIVEHHCKLENDVRIHSQTFIPEYSLVKNKSWIGPNVVLTNAKYPNSPSAKNNLEGPIIGEKAIIGANVTLLPGVKVADSSFVAAGSIVTKNTKKYGVYAGSPAKLVKLISEIKEYEKYSLV